jgi:hypothetical protein
MNAVTTLLTQRDTREDDLKPLGKPRYSPTFAAWQHLPAGGDEHLRDHAPRRANL